MKKTVSVLLAVLMLFSVFAVSFSVIAEGEAYCEFCHKLHVEERDKCECCLVCPFLNMNVISDCAKEGNTLKDRSDFCCDECKGFITCNCGHENPNCTCGVCNRTGDSQEPEVPSLSEETQIHLNEIFQRILRRIAEIFDRMFEVAFAIFNVR